MGSGLKVSTLLSDLKLETQSFDYFDEIVSFHAEHVLSTTKLPAKNASQIKKALPFALEEGLTRILRYFISRRIRSNGQPNQVSNHQA